MVKNPTVKHDQKRSLMSGSGPNQSSSYHNWLGEVSLKRSLLQEDLEEIEQYPHWGQV